MFRTLTKLDYSRSQRKQSERDDLKFENSPLLNNNRSQFE